MPHLLHCSELREWKCAEGYVKWNNKIFTKNCTQKLAKDMLHQLTIVVWQKLFVNFSMKIILKNCIRNAQFYELALCL